MQHSQRYHLHEYDFDEAIRILDKNGLFGANYFNKEVFTFELERQIQGLLDKYFEHQQEFYLGGDELITITQENASVDHGMRISVNFTIDIPKKQFSLTTLVASRKEIDTFIWQVNDWLFPDVKEIEKKLPNQLSREERIPIKKLSVYPHQIRLKTSVTFNKFRHGKR